MRAGLGLAFGLVLTAHAAPELTLRWAEQRLTVRLHDVPAYEVLAEFARQSGAEIRGALREPGTVSAEFDDLPVAEALHRLFGAESFALVYGDGDRLREVRLLGAPGPVDAPRPAAEPPTRVVVAPDDTVTAVSKRPVPVEGRLARALGSSTATFEKLFETGLGARDESVR